MKEYILLQNLPNVREGEIFVHDGLTGKYRSKNKDIYGEFTYYQERVLIDNPGWFKIYNYKKKEFTIDDMRKCFEAAREIDFSGYSCVSPHKRKSFEWYMGTIQKNKFNVTDIVRTKNGKRGFIESFFTTSEGVRKYRVVGQGINSEHFYAEELELY